VEESISKLYEKSFYFLVALVCIASYSSLVYIAMSPYNTGYTMVYLFGTSQRLMRRKMRCGVVTIVSILLWCTQNVIVYEKSYKDSNNFLKEMWLWHSPLIGWYSCECQYFMWGPFSKWQDPCELCIISEEVLKRECSSELLSADTPLSLKVIITQNPSPLAVSN
jgi:hypothetical protein